MKLCMDNVGILRLDLVCFVKYVNMKIWVRMYMVVNCVLRKCDGFRRMKMNFDAMEREKFIWIACCIRVVPLRKKWKSLLVECYALARDMCCSEVILYFTKFTNSYRIHGLGDSYGGIRVRPLIWRCHK